MWTCSIAAGRRRGRCWRSLGGCGRKSALIRLPVTPPTVTLFTGEGPYGDLINFGQSLIDDDILNVSILGGFAYSDTPKNGWQSS